MSFMADEWCMYWGGGVEAGAMKLALNKQHKFFNQFMDLRGLCGNFITPIICCSDFSHYLV